MTFGELLVWVITVAMGFGFIMALIHSLKEKDKYEANEAVWRTATRFLIIVSIWIGWYLHKFDAPVRLTNATERATQ